MWYVLEALDETADYFGANITALTPEVCHELDTRGIKYHIVEDFYHESNFFKGQDDYLFDQLKWFGRFDALFKNRLSACSQEDISPAIAHYYRIKCFVDSLVVYSQVFSEAIKGMKASQARYVCKELEDAETSLYMPFDRQKDVVRLLFRKICEARGVAFHITTLPVDVREEPYDLAKDSIKGFLRKLQLRTAYRLFKYEKWKRPAAAGKTKAPNIFSLHAGCIPLDELAKDTLLAGGNVFLKEGRQVLLLNDVLEKRALDLDAGDIGYGAIKVRNALEAVLADFMRDRTLAGWVSEKCGVDVADIIKPYFSDLIVDVCLQNLTEVPILKKFYAKEKIDFVVARASSEKEAVSSLMAAASGKKKVCFQHACGAFDARRNYINEFMHFDSYFAMHGEAEEQSKNIMAENPYLGSCGIYQAPYQIAEVRKRWASSKRDKDLILYIPTKLFFGFCCLNDQLYPITWYYRLQKTIIDRFCERDDLRFIYKYAPGQSWVDASLLKYIEEKGAKNISIEKRPVSECLGKAGRAILDYPSTSLYEAASVGMPVMSLYHEMLTIRPEAEKLFGRSLCKFSDINAAGLILDEFLSADPEPYKVNIPMADVDVVEVLRGIKAGR